MHTTQFEEVTPKRWAAIKAKFAEQAGVKISSDQGHGDDHGVSFSWAFNLNTAILVVNILSVSWLVKAAGYSEEKVLGKFIDWVNEVKAEVPVEEPVEEPAKSLDLFTQLELNSLIGPPNQGQGQDDASKAAE